MKNIITTGAVAVAMLAIAPVQAKDWVESQTLHILAPGPTVKVYGSNGQYKTVPDQAMNFNTMVDAECKGSKRLKSHKLVGANDPQSGTVIEGVGNQWAHMTITNPDSGRPFFSGLTNMLLKSKVSKYPRPQYQQPGEAFVNACNIELAKKIGQGSSKFALLKNGFSTTMSQPLTLMSQCVRKNNSSKYYWESIVKYAPITVACQAINGIPGEKVAPPKASKPKGPNSLSLPFAVTQASLKATPGNYVGQCPAKISFNGKVGANAAGTVKFRWVGSNGAKSPIRTLKFNKADVADVSFDLDIGKPKGMGFKAGPKGNGGSNLNKELSAPQDVKSGFYQIQIVSPTAGKKASNQAWYQYKCSAGGNSPAPKPLLQLKAK